MPEVKVLKSYVDENNNEIIYTGDIHRAVLVTFKGKNNKLVISSNANLLYLNIQFDCDNAIVQIGGHKGVMPLKLFARLGADARVQIGNNVSTTDRLALNAAEGSSITIGNDVLIAAQVEIRCDDSHPIFDIHTGKRVNPARSVSIGSHVWIAKKATIMGGVSVGDGSVIGLGSVVTKDVPNNCIVAGIPARVVRRDIGWERPHLSMASPSYKPDVSHVRKSEEFWNPTLEMRLDEIPQLPENKYKLSFFHALMRRLGYEKVRR